MKIETRFEVGQPVWRVEPDSREVVGPNHIADINISVTPGDRRQPANVSIHYSLIEVRGVYCEACLYGGKWAAVNVATYGSCQQP